MKRSRIKDLLNSKESGIDVVTAGWVRTRRASKGGFSFIELNDGSCLNNIQILAFNDLPNYDSEIGRLHPGASIVVEGELVQSEGSGQALEIKAAKIRVLGHADPMEYPLGKQRINLERLREIPHLRARTNSFGAVARVRDLLTFEITRFFHDRGFLYVHTPIITGSDCEGAGAMFQVTTLDPANIKKDESGQPDYSEDFFGQRAALTVSGQLEGETYACALGNIYTFGPTFRAENSNTRRHLSEFWMVEPEMAFADLSDDADLAQDFLQHLFNAVLTHCKSDLEFFNKRIKPGLIERLERLAQATFARISYTDAIEMLIDSDQGFEFDPHWGMDMQSEHERYLAEEIFKGPVVVTDYPKDIKAFYMRRNDDGRTVAAMDVLLPEVGEIIGGSQREERLDHLIDAMRASNLDPKNYTEYLDLRRYGSVPHAGFGLGFERLVQFCTGMHNIRDVIPYPRAPKRL
ncbi:MAG: asparagine--tRNA ligase [Kiritimatiellae bacterium]|jgi:asparaginyl-tRNA synthetase|nr:asparagine--tRNA ligase [Kiritimatiellia bacterium]